MILERNRGAVTVNANQLILVPEANKNAMRRPTYIGGGKNPVKDVREVLMDTREVDMPGRCGRGCDAVKARVAVVDKTGETTRKGAVGARFVLAVESSSR